MTARDVATCLFESNGTRCAQRQLAGNEYCEEHLVALTTASVLEAIIRIVQGKLFVERSMVTVESRFIKDLGADSLDAIDLFMDCEEVFGIEIPEEDQHLLDTVGSTRDYVTHILVSRASYILSVESLDDAILEVTSSERKNVPERESEAFRMLKSEILAGYYKELGHSFDSIRRAIIVAVAGQEIRYLTFIPDVKKRKVSAVHIMLLTNTLFVNLDIEQSKLRTIHVPLRDLTLRPDYEYDQDNNIKSIVIHYEAHNHKGVEDNCYTFENETGIEGATSFLKKYFAFRELASR